MSAEMDGHPDLFALLTGELDNAEAVAAGDHLETCGACRSDLAETAVGHALLRRSARTLGGADPAPALPPMVSPRRRPRRAVLAAAAVAAVVGVGLGGVATAVLTDRTVTPAPAPTSPASPVAVAPLTAYGDTGSSVRGEVELYTGGEGHTRMRIQTADLPPAGSSEFYYAWLLDPQTQKMLPLGQVGPDGGSFDVADTTLAAYSAVDISLEADDGDPGHSVTSVLRGRL